MDVANDTQANHQNPVSTIDGTGADEDFAPKSASLRMLGRIPALLAEQWDITVWSMRIKRQRIKLKMEAHRPVDEPALRAWFLPHIGTEWELCLKFCPRSKCCGNACTGCLIGHLEKKEKS